ncbi:MAG TPA: hypothetical protein VFX98_09400, partial [Longimicrobiaceae bacterium]|nr:hypothetical protein [Longimicrobiaceae bacterium]
VFGADHSRHGHVQADLATALLRQRRHADALPLLRQLVSKPSPTGERAQLLAAFAHAAAGAGANAEYTQAAAGAWDLLDRGIPAGAAGAAALAELGKAAAVLRDWSRVREVAVRVQELATSVDSSTSPDTWQLLVDQEWVASLSAPAGPYQ